MKISGMVAGYLTAHYGYPVAYWSNGAVALLALLALAAMAPALRGMGSHAIFRPPQ